jgi:Zn-dependent protease/predicted transcriptional regulator
MTRQNIVLGRIKGIRIGLDYSWFLVFALLTWVLAVNYYPSEFKDWSSPLYWIMGAVTAILLFASVLLHELGHSVVALKYGIPVRSIKLFIFGGVAQIGSEPPSALSEFLIAVAGPLVSLTLGVIFYVSEPFVASIHPLFGLVRYLALINLALVIFNLIPGFPLDGGRVFRAFVWAITGNMRRSTLIASNVGRFFGLLLIGLGVWQVLSGNLIEGLWIAFIGWFLDSAASAQANYVNLQALLEGYKVSQVMNRDCTTVREDLTLKELVDKYILGGIRRCALVTHGDDTVGLMTLHRIKSVPTSEWSSRIAADVMLPRSEWKKVEPETDLWAALQQMDRDGVNQLPVSNNDHVIGMLGREDVITFLRTLQELKKEPNWQR